MSTGKAWVAFGLSAVALALATPVAAKSLEMEGRAAAAATVTRGQARFTVLTSGLIRMEWSPTARFVDTPSQVFIDREQPVPRFTTTVENGRLVIRTDALELSYTLDSGRFTATNLSVRSRTLKPAFSWSPGTAATGNLHGTARTLDRYSGDRQIDNGTRLDLGQGLISRDGWHVVDDSSSFVFDGDRQAPWVQKRACGDCQDLYFFGYGHDYTAALGDYAKVAGRQPMPPRFAFGYWWSRYWNYSDRELRDLVGDLDRTGFPLDVLVIDMDWHRTDDLSWDPRYVVKDEVGEGVGWTGYSWNRSLFPDPKRFLSWLEQRKVKATLNLHPASGIPPREETYAAFAKAMGVTDGKAVPFEGADRRFVDNWFKLTLDPLTAQGVDFWWLDWQQWPDSKLMPGLSNTWWLNHLFYTRMQQADANRALIYHRWGGLGNHRYQIGFSGDAVITWDSLAYQPYFTATASNVLYGYWSHDIGGHMFADGLAPEQRKIDPELYVRWMQFGAFSPILRTHSAKDGNLRKEPWRFSPEVLSTLRDTVALRYQLAPYIYTASRQAYDTGVSILRPLYYAWPDQAQAYAERGQYMFGDDMLLAPVTKAGKDGVTQTSIWLPPGQWYDSNRGEILSGDRAIVRDYLLNEIPLFVRAGAVIPMNPPSMQNLQQVDGSKLVLRVLPGGTARTRLYEDAGDSEGYRGDAYSFTPITSARDTGQAQLTVHPREGRYPGMAAARQITIEFPAATLPTRVTVNGATYSRSDGPSEGSWHYDGSALTARIVVPAIAADAPLTVQVAFAPNTRIEGLTYRMKRTAAAVAWLKDHWPAPEPLPDDVSLAGQFGQLVDYDPERLTTLIAEFDQRSTRLVPLVQASRASPEVKAEFARRIAMIRAER
ncbi:glycoside hydrolase family 31 protein [Sphingomonas sp. R647]|uniref:glycoside hydrolase family 31 protein n=1 Tax=Sphingomonas sp. R647 TaxID=2875233 RepID=UPI001CD2EB2A|nr:glycoside hydrolase family 31 protein [Sphingomonas sp. R647]MCA1196555.1 glycoside hydrolase family 31 protein [Sphingomonas sp. R647]